MTQGAIFFVATIIVDQWLKQGSCGASVGELTFHNRLLQNGLQFLVLWKGGIKEHTAMPFLLSEG
jgi:hypothetical protein